jgi:spoIIIJ-associated protein
MEWVESTGDSIEEAKERALDRLGVHEDDAEFEVVAEVKTGLFGRVKEPARVRARVAPTTPPAKDERRRNRKRSRGRGGDNGGRTKGGQGRGSSDRGGRGGGGSSETEATKTERSSSGSRRDSARSAADGGGKRAATMSTSDSSGSGEATMPLEDQADLAETFVRGLAEHFGTSVTFDRQAVDDEEIRITVSGDDLGRMIGHRGSTAAAIDDLVRTVLQRQAGSSRNGRIRVDVGGVRARRNEALAAFARSQAAEVRADGRPRALEPMSSADRKVVHDTLTDEDGVETVSEGEDSQRRVVIVPAGGD